MSTALSHALANQMLLGGAMSRKRRTVRRKPRTVAPSAKGGAMRKRRRYRGGIHPALLGLLTHVIAPVVSHNLNRIPFVKKIREKIGIGKVAKRRRPVRKTGKSYMLPGAPRVRRARGGAKKKRQTKRLVYRAPVLNPF
jgi:hypothetical protein